MSEARRSGEFVPRSQYEVGSPSLPSHRRTSRSSACWLRPVRAAAAKAAASSRLRSRHREALPSCTPAANTERGCEPHLCTMAAQNARKSGVLGSGTTATAWTRAPMARAYVRTARGPAGRARTPVCSTPHRRWAGWKDAPYASRRAEHIPRSQPPLPDSPPQPPPPPRLDDREPELEEGDVLGLVRCCCKRVRQPEERLVELAPRDGGGKGGCGTGCRASLGCATARPGLVSCRRPFSRSATRGTLRRAARRRVSRRAVGTELA